MSLVAVKILIVLIHIVVIQMEMVTTTILICWRYINKSFDEATKAFSAPFVVVIRWEYARPLH